MTDTMLIPRWETILADVPASTKLIAVSKYTTDAKVEALLAAGQLDFAESRPQNLRDRAQRFPKAQWHMIGPLQKNKAKYIAKHAYMWHSLCDIETAQAVAKHVEGRVLPVLIQVNISGEAQKQGVLCEDLSAFFAHLQAIDQLQVIGLMGMAAKNDDAQPAFVRLRQCRDSLQDMHPDQACDQLCMGMSNDWRIAIKEQATMIRIGTAIFGTDT